MVQITQRSWALWRGTKFLHCVGSSDSRDANEKKL
jgi:hypothetical protein